MLLNRAILLPSLSRPSPWLRKIFVSLSEAGPFTPADAINADPPFEIFAPVVSVTPRMVCPHLSPYSFMKRYATDGIAGGKPDSIRDPLAASSPRRDLWTKRPPGKLVV